MRTLITRLGERLLTTVVPKASGHARCMAVARNCGPCNADGVRRCCWIEGACHEVCAYELCW